MAAPPDADSTESGPLRPNVCAVVTDAERRKVLVFRRADVKQGAHRWQFPQGGLHAGEAPEDALLRELREEIGTDAVEVLARPPEPIAYRYPPEVLADLRRRKPAKGAFVGQAQSWFLVRLRGDTTAIRFDHQPAEFDAYEWVTPEEALRRVVPFKAAAYRAGLVALGLLPAEARAVSGEVGGTTGEGKS